MEADTKANLLTLLILADGILTYATLTAGGAGGREANPLFATLEPAAFVYLALVKAALWVLVWPMVGQAPHAHHYATLLVGAYGLLGAWNLGNLAVNL